jgi:hypothetical protein
LGGSACWQVRQSDPFLKSKKEVRPSYPAWRERARARARLYVCARSKCAVRRVGRFSNPAACVTVRWVESDSYAYDARACTRMHVAVGSDNCGVEGVPRPR